jgi:hypothetical protein
MHQSRGADRRKPEACPNAQHYTAPLVIASNPDAQRLPDVYPNCITSTPVVTALGHTV